MRRCRSIVVERGSAAPVPEHRKRRPAPASLPVLRREPMRHVAFVTGGGRGIGREIAGALVHPGVAVAVAARTRADVEDVASPRRATGGQTMAVTLDAGDAEAVPLAVPAVSAT